MRGGGGDDVLALPVRQAAARAAVAAQVVELGHARPLADRVAERLEQQLLRRLRQVLKEPPDGADAAVSVLPDDTIVDQMNGRMPKDLYLRLAREGAFPSWKDGKRVYAMWGEVRAAFTSRMRRRRPGKPAGKAKGKAKDNAKAKDDENDPLRVQLGLKKKGE